jgi:hypothetical protein
MAASRRAGSCGLRRAGIVCMKTGVSQPAKNVAVTAGYRHTEGRLRGFQFREHWQEYARVLADLRLTCPPAMPVIVRTSRLPSYLAGCCRRYETRFVIQLNADMGEIQAVETLLHEWAHAVSWHYRLDTMMERGEYTREEWDQISHDAAWGCAYAQVWRAYVQGLADDAAA